MFQNTPAWRAHVCKRMRTNAHLAIRHDAYRFMPPGSPRYVGRDVVRYFWPDPQNDQPRQADERKDQRDLAAERRELLWMQSELAAIEAELKLRRLARDSKAYNPNQPRIPAGSREGGQWTNEGGQSAAEDGLTSPKRIQLAGPLPPNDPPEIPKEKPAAAKERARVLREAGKWLAKIARTGARVETFSKVLEGVSWIRDQIPNIQAYRDAPKSLEELQQAVSKTTTPGYQDHHIVEQNSVRPGEEGMIDAPDNLVRIPTLRHRQINGWYQETNKDFDGLPPREWLRDKSWEVRRSLGLRALMKFEVLKP
jgi:hypothetical protein